VEWKRWPGKSLLQAWLSGLVGGLGQGVAGGLATNLETSGTSWLAWKEVWNVVMVWLVSLERDVAGGDGLDDGLPG
jgi:hypothetical protein